ncbi:MAG: helix-turn-helix domain-containing protein [Bacteroidetes bacterium]|nr:helix-turn-helix domain-containing protein [Bacteroidota bacterium]
MQEITHNNMPEAISLVYTKLLAIERMLQSQPGEVPVERDSFLNIKQAAELLTLAVPTVYCLVSKGELPVHKRGKRLYFSSKELLDWIKAGRKKTTDEVRAEAEAFTSRTKR